ncbi:MAG: hypothetical protein GY716_20125 [bacterium]|nr:hypothetical protein [bacterium]
MTRKLNDDELDKVDGAGDDRPMYRDVSPSDQEDLKPDPGAPIERRPSRDLDGEENIGRWE